MTAFHKVQTWLTQDQHKSFPPLDEDGYSSFAPATGGIVYLYASPEEDGEAFMYSPLISLKGIASPARLNFLWDLAEANMPGALPSNYRFFADRQDAIVCLGCQFEAEALDYAGFFGLMDAFARYAGVERERLGAELDSLAEESDLEEDTENEVPGLAAPEESLPDAPWIPSLLRV